MDLDEIGSLYVTVKNCAAGYVNAENDGQTFNEARMQL
jgi:hypothetical protein